jgi:hypothetical protein
MIAAAADEVWRLTIDVENMPSLTPTMQKVERLDGGPLQVGSRTRIKQPGQFPAVWTVTDIEEGRAFVWQSRRLWYTMAGTHHLEALGADRCRNTLIVELTGPGSGLLGRLVGPSVRKAIGIENAGFKSAAETKP